MRRGLRLVLAGTAITLATTSSMSASTMSPVAGPGWVGSAPQPLSTTLHLPGLSTGDPTQPASARPNIIFVLTDDLSWNLIKYMPYVRKLQAQGATFTNYFVSDSLCCPSRTSIFTGLLPHNNGVYRNTGSDGGFNAFLAHGDQSKCYAAALQRQGYVTGMMGKYLNGYQPANSYLGQVPYIPPGWSAWDVADGHGYNEYGYTLAVGHQLGQWGSAPRDYLTSVLNTKAHEFVAASARAKRPFMLELATFAPHLPFVPAPQDVHKFPGLKAPRSGSFGRAVANAPPWLKRIPPLTAANKRGIDRSFRLRVQDMQSVDRMVASLEQQLKRLGVAKNTYLVFSSDNGFHLGEHDLRQGKQTAFDTDIRVPLIVVGPGVRAGSTIPDLAENIDLAPTFETMAGLTPPVTMDGHSLTPLLAGAHPSRWRSAVLIEHHGPDLVPADPDYQPPYSGNPPSYEAIRTRRYLYVEYRDGEHEFYDLRRDPNELANRYASMPVALRNRLQATLTHLEHCSGTTCFQPLAGSQ
ncbi:MAG: sulfatase family protein [Nocardioidaceae bacterium]